jgi:hypothetical protein
MRITSESEQVVLARLVVPTRIQFLIECLIERDREMLQNTG